jgi:hypothetical protein
MLDPDFTPLPVYDAIKAYANQPPRMYPGTHQEDHWAVTWAGEWLDQSDDAAMLGRYRLAGQDATARVCVEGGRVEVVRAPGSDQEAQLTIEKGDDGCLTLRAEAGVAIDGFIVRRQRGPVWVWALILLSVIVVLGWKMQNRRRGTLIGTSPPSLAFLSVYTIIPLNDSSHHRRAEYHQRNLSSILVRHV